MQQVAMLNDRNEPEAEDTGRNPARPAADVTLAQRMLAALRDGADLRRRKVRRLRAAIRVSRYENPLKLQVALDRLRHDVSGPAPQQE